MRLRLLYWISTAQIALVMVGGGMSDALRTESALLVMRHLGYPDYFSTILGVAQVLGAIALLAPVPRAVREWAYAGFTVDIGAAILSILAVGDPLRHVAIPLYAFAMLQLSYFAWRRRERAGSSSTLAAPEPLTP
jgi:predicted cation transporter